MSEHDDLNEFNKKVSSGSDHPRDGNIATCRESRLGRLAREMRDELKCEETEPGGLSGHSKMNSQMWAVYGDRRYSACEKAVDVLPPGQYIVDASSELGIHFRKTDANLDDLVELPDSVSEQIINEIETFWKREDRFRTYGFLWKRGVLMWGPPGGGKCLGKGTPILMYDGTIKCVEDIIVGDLLMGDDSTPRAVLSLARGHETMYKVHQRNGDDYIVNKSHILSLVRSTWKKGRYNPHKHTTEVQDIEITQYLNSSPNFKKEWFGYKVSVDFPSQVVPITPYLLGVWLGDGSSSGTSITTMDPEVVSFLETYACETGLKLSKWINKNRTSGLADTYNICSESPREGANYFRTALQRLNLIDNKHIPQIYKSNDRQTRLQLLAGLLDSDGYLSPNGFFEFSNKNQTIIKDIVFLTRSLGFKVSVSPKFVANETYYSVYISGHLDQIPTRIKRKQGQPRKQIKNPLHTSISLEELDENEYYGFEIDGNHRFVLGDFTVTHNTSTLQVISQRIIDRGGISLYVNDPGLTARGLSILRRVEPTRPLVVMIEDIDAVINDHGESELLALMDGELQIDNVIFIATTNYPELLDKRFINRPSRFDVVKKIGMPTPAAREVYLEHKSARLNEDKAELKRWVTATEGFSIAHIKELIISVEVFEIPMADAVKRLKTMMNASPSSSEKDGEFGF